MKKRCIQCTLKTNRYQLQYLKHHIYSTGSVYRSVCRKLYKERVYRAPRTTQEMKGLCKESHREYLRIMDEKEIMAMVHDLLHYQWSLRQKKIVDPSTFFACILTDYNLKWRSISLLPMLSNECLQALSKKEFLYARMQVHHNHIQLRIYIKLCTKA